METNASFVRITLVAIAAVAAVACAGPSSKSSNPQPGSNGPADGTGGNGSDGSTGSGGGGGGGGGSGGSAGSGGGGGGGGGDTNPDGGVTAATLGCSGYVQCLLAAMSDADAMKCDSEAKPSATMLVDAVDQCVGNYCLGMSGAAARCKHGTDGSLQNLDGTAAFDMNGAPSGDCGACLVNGEAGLWGDTCMPANDPACNTAACASQTSACQADK